jgi:hypothetical protein
MIDPFQYASGRLVATTDLPPSLSPPFPPLSLALLQCEQCLYMHAGLSLTRSYPLPFRFQYKHALPVAAARIPAVPYLQLSRATACVVLRTGTAPAPSEYRHD